MNSKRMVRCVIVTLVVLICSVIAVFGVVYYRAMTEDYEDDLTTVEQDLKIVTETYPTQFIVYGDTIDLDASISVKYIKEISEASLELSKDYRYQLIIINDLSGSCKLSEDDWKLLNDLLAREKRRNLFYFGNKEFNNIKKLDITSDMLSYEDSDLSVGFVYEKDKLITVSGTYTKESKYLLSEALLHEQANSIKISNE